MNNILDQTVILSESEELILLERSGKILSYLHDGYAARLGFFAIAQNDKRGE